MQPMNKLNNDVYVASAQFPSVGAGEIEFLKEELPNSSRGRTRLCLHKENSDRMHEMFISFTGDNYVRPSLHHNKEESLHVVNGSAAYIFFDESGRPIDAVPLGVYDSGRQFYCRIPSDHYHALVINSDEISIHETTEGPFNPADTFFAQWSPEEKDATVREYRSSLLAVPVKPRPRLKMERTGEEAFVAAEPIVSVGKGEIEFLKGIVNETTRKRVRLCAHKDSNERLHEMFVIYMDKTYVRPNKHLNKDESLHILEGEADFFFFDEVGNITAVIPLGDRTTGRDFYNRVPAFAYHSMIMRSERIVIHEATPGPFYREDTVWAPWSPDFGDTAGIEAFMGRLREAAAHVNA
jgi:cupin fold WbuC family metalloprotein